MPYRVSVMEIDIDSRQHGLFRFSQVSSFEGGTTNTLYYYYVCSNYLGVITQVVITMYGTRYY